MSVPSRNLRAHSRRSPATAMVAAVAVLLAASAGVAFAADPPAPAATPAPAVAATPAAPSTGTRIRQEAPRDLDGVLVIGAVNDPQDAAAPEDTSVPELPMATDTGHR